MSTVSILRSLHIADSVAKNRAGNLILRQGYFYHHGQTAEGFAQKVSKALDAEGISHRVVAHGDHWAAFRGGAPLARSSHFWVEIELH